MISAFAVISIACQLLSNVADEWESCSSEDSEDSDGSWIDVHHSSDEEQSAVTVIYFLMIFLDDILTLYVILVLNLLSTNN